MTTPRIVAIYLLVLAGLVLITAIVLECVMPPIGYTHQGTLTINDRQEMNNLKSWLSLETTELINLSVLNSDYPAIIKFEADSDDDKSLFGEKVKTIPNNYLLIQFASFLLAVPAVLLWEQ